MTNSSSTGLSNGLFSSWRRFGYALRQSAASPFLSWLRPEISVQLLAANGDRSQWSGDGHLFWVDAARRKPGQYVAVEVPEFLLLWRAVNVPNLSAQDLKQALVLEANAASPFLPDDLVWGYCLSREGQRQSGASLCLASRKQIDQHLQSLQSQLLAGKTPQLWAMRPGLPPVVLPGSGDEVIDRAVSWRRSVNYALAACAFAICVCMALTPVAQLRLRAVESTAALDVLREKTRDELKKRETLQRLGESIKMLQEVTANAVNALPVLSHMTDLLPDDTSLFSISVQGGKVSLYGQTPNAAALMQRLSDEPGLKDVKAPVPAVRANASAKDNFTIDFNLGAVLTAPSASELASGIKP